MPRRGDKQAIPMNRTKTIAHMTRTTMFELTAATLYFPDWLDFVSSLF
jgi:hypothetical protein